MPTQKTSANERARSRFQTVIEQELIDRLKTLVLAARNIVVTCHVSPDGA